MQSCSAYFSPLQGQSLPSHRNMTWPLCPNSILLGFLPIPCPNSCEKKLVAHISAVLFCSWTSMLRFCFCFFIQNLDSVVTCDRLAAFVIDTWDDLPALGPQLISRKRDFRLNTPNQGLRSNWSSKPWGPWKPESGSELIIMRAFSVCLVTVIYSLCLNIHTCTEFLSFLKTAWKRQQNTSETARKQNQTPAVAKDLGLIFTKHMAKKTRQPVFFATSSK